MCSIVHSLCNFLHRNHNLKSIVINMQTLKGIFNSEGRMDDLLDSLPKTLYPLKLLGPIVKKVEVIPVDIKQILTPSHATVSLANQIAIMSTLLFMDQIRLAERTCRMIDNDTADRILVAERKKKHLHSKLPNVDVFNFNGLMQMFLTAMQAVRTEWHEHRSKYPTKECKEQVKDLMQLEIELRLLVPGLVAVAEEEDKREAKAAGRGPS